MKLTFAKVGAQLIVGMVDEDAPRVFHKPRIVLQGQKEVALVTLTGNPSTMIVENKDFVYTGEDKDFEDFYTKETSSILTLH